MAEEKKPQKVTMIVNGQPIDMCLKTIILSNTRAQKVLRSLKQQSLNDVKTLRLFWGDVVMLNIITNQMLQTVDSRDLSRVLKPVNSVKEDILEYRKSREQKKKNLKDALITAFDSNLPLDYSSELEKYYKDEYLDKDKKEENDFKDTIKEINSDEQSIFSNDNDIFTKENTYESAPKPENNNQSQRETTTQKKKNRKPNKPKSETNEKSATNNGPRTEKQKRAIYKTDEDEETIDFLSLLGGQIKDDDNETDTKQSKPIEDFILDRVTNSSENSTIEQGPTIDDNKLQRKQTEFSAAQEAFTSYDSLDLDKLFN